jgi:predicted nucleotidyltransferase
MDSVKRELKSRMDKLEVILKDQKNLKDQMEKNLKDQMETILKDQMEKILKDQMERNLEDQMETREIKTILDVLSQSTEAVH